MHPGIFIGIDIGGTKIYGGLVSPSGEILATQRVPTPPKAGSKDILSLIDKLVKNLLKDKNFRLKDVLGIGLAVPGIVDNNGHVVITPNINLSNTDLKKILEKKYKTRIAVGNDVNLGVLGETWLGAGRKSKNIVGIFPGTGVGGGIIVNGSFLTGSQGAAAEIGHMVVDMNGPSCTCGNTGCLEALCGRWAMERDIRAAVKKGTRSVITKIAGPDLKQIKSSALAKALKARDPLVTHILGEAATALGRACVSLNHLFNPEMFLFGGGVIEACGDFILPRVERAIKHDPFFTRLTPPKIVEARLGDDAVMLGAVAAVRKDVDLKKLGGSYYPAIRLTPAGKVSVKGTVFSSCFYIRADGKVREPKDFFPPLITEEELDEICKKGPDHLFIAAGHGKKVALSPKGMRLLKKKHVLPCILPLARAVRAYDASDERKAILFYI